MTKNEIKTILNEKPEFRIKLFCRGFLITDDAGVEREEYPFYGSWSEQNHGKHRVICHPQIKAFMYDKYCLVGHAMNPCRKIADENRILKDIAEREDAQGRLDYINELTGVFVLLKFDGDSVSFISDPVGLQAAFYISSGGKYYISSHSNLIGDLLNLEKDEFISKLSKAKYFSLFGNQLPGNLTQLSGLRRCVPNHIVSMGSEITETRFYWPYSPDLSKAEAEEKLIELLQNTMELIPQKWAKPGISLTGGCDSKTVLACTKENFDKYVYFSYNSVEKEKPDVESAKKICDALGLKHLDCEIPYSDDEIPDIETVRALILWNCGDVLPNNKNDVRKRAVLDKVTDFDVDVKSWASEVGRSRYTKRYAGRVDFGNKPTPRVCTTFYKFLYFNRGLVHKTDLAFAEYLDKYFESAKERPIPWQDQFYWEWHWPSRDGITLTSEHKYSGDMTIPYNNRKILELLLSAPEEDRINDTVYADIRQKLCPEIDAAGGSVVNANHTKLRAELENFYYVMNGLLPY